MSLQHFDMCGEKGHEAFGADPVCSGPDQEQGVLNFWSVMVSAPVQRDELHLFCMLEEIHGVLAIIAGRCCKGIQHFALLLDRRCRPILWDHAASVIRVWFADSIRFPRLPPLVLSCASCLCRDERGVSDCLSPESDPCNAL